MNNLCLSPLFVFNFDDAGSHATCRIKYPSLAVDKLNIVKISFLIWYMFCLAAFSCTKSIIAPPVPEVPISELGKYNMKILPDNPTSADDVKLVIYQDCKYNKLTGVQRSLANIDIVKQYNSMIMAPCIMTNDTILIGKLPVNIYKVYYRLVDIAVQPGKTTFSVSFKLEISK
jgi:hypothetical protein